MTNEWKEFTDYTGQPQYTAKSKSDKTFLGRFTLDMILNFTGFNRICTILARGYMFHDKDGNLIPGDPYERVNYTRRALLAWCSIPDRSKDPKVRVCFPELHEEFPELVDEDGKGWYFRHVKALLKFIANHHELVNKTLSYKQEGIAAGFTSHWKKKVRQFQVPIFALNTKGAWTIRFDDIIADAIEAGPLRKEEYLLSEEKKKQLDDLELKKSVRRYAEDLTAFYFANKTDDNDWVILPIANFNAYYRSTTFEKEKLHVLPHTVFFRQTNNGLCRLMILL